MPSSLLRRLLLAVGLLPLLWLCSRPASAQLQLIPDTAPDRNLGTQVVPVNPQVDLIRGGTRPQNGQNLFHSFQEFNIRENRGAYFANPAGVQNILTRVTGNDPSDLLGTLGVLGPANLFFINPNGMIFGQNARLDLKGGSFYGTTASGIKFGAVGEFGAVNPQPPSNLLTINPSAFFFTAQPPQEITNQSQVGLRVPNGETLLLLGGNVTINGGQMIAYDGRVEIGAVTGAGTVGLNANGSLSVPDGVQRGDISFSNVSLVNVQLGSGSGGDIGITGNNISILSGSVLSAGILPGRGTATSQAGDITLNATGQVQVAGQFTSIGNVVSSNATGDGGNLKITANSLEVKDGAQLSANTFGRGDGGNVMITASDRVLFDNGNAFTNVRETGVGRGGNIQISTNSLEVLNRARLIAGTDGTGDGGSVVITAHDRVLFNNSFVFSNVGDVNQTIMPQGNGGNIQIFATSLEVLNGARLIANTYGIGDAGNVVITARDRVRFDNGYALSSVEPGAVGKGGNVQIDSSSLEVLNRAQLVANIHSRGDGGNVVISARDRVVFDNGDAFTNVGKTGVGRGGNIQISTNSLEVLNRARLIAGTDGTGDGGSVVITAHDRVLFNNSFVFSNVGDVNQTIMPQGNGGNIQIFATSLEVLNGARLIASTYGIGDAGNVVITARDRVRFDNGYALSSVEETGRGQGGNVQIDTNTLEVLNGAQLIAGTDGTGDGRNVVITARDRVVFSGTSANGQHSSAAFSSVSATGRGQGGNVQIDTNTLEVLNGAQLIAGTDGIGDAGNVVITARDRVLFDNGTAFSSVGKTGVGNGGNVQILTNALEILNGAQLIANTDGIGDAGNVVITARDRVRFDNGYALSSVEETGRGQGGNVQIDTNTLEVLNGAQLIAATQGTGDAGNVVITARDRVLLSGTSADRQFPSAAFSSVGAGAEGKGGNVQIDTVTLEVLNGAGLTASTSGTGDAGNVVITARDHVLFDNGYTFSGVETRAVGQGGNVQIDTSILKVLNGAGLTASSFGTGDAGNISIDIKDTVFLDNSSIAVGVGSGGNGKAGDIELQARTLTATGGAQISSFVGRTIGEMPGGQGQGGNIRVDVTDSITLSGTNIFGFSSGILTLSERGASGNAGNITVNTGDLRITDGALIIASTFNNGSGGNIFITGDHVELVNGGQIVTNTRSSGKAGNITLNVRDSLLLVGSDPNLDNRLNRINQYLQLSAVTDQPNDVIINVGGISGLFANTELGSSGDGGNIFINSPRTTIRDSAGVVVSSQGFGQGGNIQIQGERVTLDNQASLSAQTASSQGGNIILQLQDLLLLRRGSQISATAGTAQQGGNGGNITINAPNGFIIGVKGENSDITANAFTGNGGRVNITAQGIFGLEFRPQLTQFSDITASSTFGLNGVVTLNTPNVDPSRGLSQLPQSLIDTNRILANSCIVRDRASGGVFIVTGTGGLPEQPGTMQPTFPTGTVRGLEEAEGRSQKSGGRRQESEGRSGAIAEAEGIYQLPDGQVVLSWECGKP